MLIPKNSGSFNDSATIKVLATRSASISMRYFGLEGHDVNTILCITILMQGPMRTCALGLERRANLSLAVKRMVLEMRGVWIPEPIEVLNQSPGSNAG